MLIPAQEGCQTQPSRDADPRLEGMLIPGEEGCRSQPIPVPVPQVWIQMPVPHLQQAAALPSSLALFQGRVRMVIFPRAVVARKK